jgi:hypothetical protein
MRRRSAKIVVAIVFSAILHLSTQASAQPAAPAAPDETTRVAGYGPAQAERPQIRPRYYGAPYAPRGYERRYGFGRDDDRRLGRRYPDRGQLYAYRPRYNDRGYGRRYEPAPRYPSYARPYGDRGVRSSRRYSTDRYAMRMMTPRWTGQWLDVGPAVLQVDQDPAE